MKLTLRLGAALAGLALLFATALAQAPGIKRNLLQRADITGPEPKECVLGTAELAAGGAVGKHLHHGIELGYVIEGESELLVDGEPPRKLKAGDSYQVPALRPHDARNSGSGTLKLAATWVVEKGKPLAEPVK